ncbi:MAG: hypothetical protein IT363_11125 [Methanoregulaceae archaeon]|nr:hypothetical protein [Methanoregulaceae archaeon]
MTSSDTNPTIEELCRHLEVTNALLAQHLALAQNWKIRLRNGLLSGLAGVLGATLLVSLFMGVLKPLQGLSRLAPILDRLERELEQR